jgi:hypothetical protein
MERELRRQKTRQQAKSARKDKLSSQDLEVSHLGLLPVSRHDHHAATLEARAATVRTPPVDFTEFILPLPTPLSGKTIFSGIAFEATGDSFGYESVSTDSQEICNLVD